jgi:polar amino acid transport system substrate-binding protein
MKKLIVVLLAGMLLLAACAEENPTADDPTEEDAAAQPEDEAEEEPEPDPCATDSLPLFADGVLTVATDRPAYPPWFEGSPKAYSGFEGDVATEVADRLGLPIEWVVEPFNKSYAPGAKDYDFDINQITITEERQQAVDFSDPYFENNQGILVMEDSPAAGAESLEDLKGVQLGAQVGTTALAFINTVIAPDAQAKIFDTTNDAKSALEAGQIDAFVTDVVTTVYLRDFEIKGSQVIGQYPEPEYFGMLFEKGNPLVECVNQVIGEMESDGTLAALEEEWLQQYLEVPTFE